MKKKESFVVRTIMDRYVLAPVGDTGRRFSGLIFANDVAAFIWTHIEEVQSAQEMAALVCEEFEVPREQALADAEELFAQFTAAGWIE